MAKRTAKTNRIWLNTDKTQPAWLIWSVEGYGRHVDAQLRISDCTRNISLDFDCDRKKKGDQNRIFRKLDKMQAELDRFRAAIEEEMER